MTSTMRRRLGEIEPPLERDRVARVVERRCDELRGLQRARRGAREDQRRAELMRSQPLADPPRVALAALRERPGDVVQCVLGRHGLRVAQQQQASHACCARRVALHSSPASSRASSDIIDWFQGGSNTSSTSARSTVGIISIFSRTSCVEDLAHAAAGRRQRHPDLCDAVAGRRALDLALVDEPELDDVDRDLRVVARAQLLPHGRFDVRFRRVVGHVRAPTAAACRSRRRRCRRCETDCLRCRS